MIRRIHTIGGIIMMAWIWISKMNVSGIFKNTGLSYVENILLLFVRQLTFHILSVVIQNSMVEEVFVLFIEETD